MASHHINKGRRHFANRLPVQGAQPVHRSTTVGSSLVTARLSTPTHSYTHNRQHTSSARHTYPACRSQCKVLRNANAATNKGGKTKKTAKAERQTRPRQSLTPTNGSYEARNAFPLSRRRRKVQRMAPGHARLDAQSSGYVPSAPERSIKDPEQAMSMLQKGPEKQWSSQAPPLHRPARLHCRRTLPTPQNILLPASQRPRSPDGLQVLAATVRIAATKTHLHVP